MRIFKDFDWSAKSIAKVAGLLLLGLVVLVIALALISMAFRTIFQGPSYRNYDQAYNKGFGAPEAMFAEPAMMSRGILPPPGGGFSTGDDAEAFEVKNYSGTIRTRKLEKTCAKLADLKVREDVIFENANQNDDNCNYRFKVKKESEAEIVEYIKDLKPEDFNENIQSIKGNIESVDKQLDILEKKLASIEETLAGAQEAYDEVTTLATRKQDVESLAIIINNKLNLIEKLTNERINVKQQIDRYNQNKADQLDRLNFSFFNINVYKDLILDWKEIKDSWKFELKAMVDNINQTIQAISVNLVVYLVRLAQAAIYFFITIFLLKFAWIATKRIWKGGKK